MENLVTWFEIPVVDFDRAKKFYSTIFDFEMQETVMGTDKMGFFPYLDKNSSGAIVMGEGYIPSKNGTLLYFNCENMIELVLSKVEIAGGRIVQDKIMISEDVGYYAKFLDTEGNIIALHSSK